MTVAARVAEEMGCAVGQTVGYSIRFEELSTPVRHTMPAASLTSKDSNSSYDIS